MEQRSSKPDGGYGEPFSWWGYRRGAPSPLSVVDLIERGSLDARLAAFLWLALERRASLMVVAAPPEAGKTTTLTALVDFLPPEVEPIYLRGWYERFAFLDEARPDRVYLLCNEISSHLPTYLWGPGVRRLFEALHRGYAMAATMHAAGPEEALATLASYPLEVPVAWLAELDLVLTLGVGRGPSGLLRRVMRVDRIVGREAQPVVEPVAVRDVLLGPLQSRPGRLIGVLEEQFGLEVGEATEELARRERFLERLRREGRRAPAEVRAAIRRLADEQG